MPGSHRKLMSSRGLLFLVLLRCAACSHTGNCFHVVLGWSVEAGSKGSSVRQRKTPDYLRAKSIGRALHGQTTMFRVVFRECSLSHEHDRLRLLPYTSLETDRA
jgi:hypothetical protein